MLQQEEPADFFISYTGTDKTWAEWVAWCLEQAGYRIIIQSWDFAPGSNFVYNMDQALKRAKRVIAVLSPRYLASEYAFSEWAEMFRRDPQGKQRLLIPIRIEHCDVQGLLGPIVYIDLIGIEEQEARQRLLQGIKHEQTHPIFVPFPVQQTIQNETDQPAFPVTLPAIWNIPYLRSPYFTGRDELLTQLAHDLNKQHIAALTQPQTLSGLGGIGKTQLAIEYAYRYSQNYDAVLWARAENQETLITSFTEIAQLLKLPIAQEKDQQITIQAVQSWLRTHQRWLFIFDNADEIDIIKHLIPSSASGGHIIITTRAQAVGRLAQKIEVDELEPDQGSLFLLRRAGLISLEANIEQAEEDDRLRAQELSQAMGGLPLALDQAGAYIEAAQCCLADYQDLYHTRRAELLAERSEWVDHPEPVATTWSISFERVEQKNAASAELLRLLAFFDPDDIPEEMLKEGKASLDTELTKLIDDPLAFNKAITILMAYSLVKRNAVEKSLSMHRLVQAVLLDTMDVESAQRRATQAIHIVDAVFPLTSFEEWEQCEHYLPHALQCIEWIKQNEVMADEPGRILYKLGNYLKDRVRYEEAERVFLFNLEVYEKYMRHFFLNLASKDQLTTEHLQARARELSAEVGVDAEYLKAVNAQVDIEALKQKLESPEDDDSINFDINTSFIFDSLGELYREWGKYEQAAELHEQNLAGRIQLLGPNHPWVATTLNNLALTYYHQSKLTEAEKLFTQTLSIQKGLSTNESDIAQTQHNIAELYMNQGKYLQAEKLFLQALATREKLYHPKHPNVMQTLSDLAQLYKYQGRYKEAEELYQRILVTREETLPPHHPHIANVLNNLADLRAIQGHYTEVETLLQRAYSIFEQSLGQEHRHTLTCKGNLGLLYQKNGHYEKAEQFLEQVLAVTEQQLGPDHPDTAKSLNNLAMLYYELNKTHKAEQLLQRSQRIFQQQFGPEHPDMGYYLSNLAQVAEDKGEYEQAENFYQQTLKITEQQLGSEHLETGKTYHNFAVYNLKQKRYMQAASYCEKALTIFSKQLGSSHADTALASKHLGDIYLEQKQYDKAITRYHIAIEIYEQLRDVKEEGLLAALNNVAECYKHQKKYTEAEQIFQRTLALFETSATFKFEDKASTLSNFGSLYYEQGKTRQAEPLMQCALDIARQHLGTNHLLTALFLNNLAQVYTRQKNYKKAESLFMQAYAIYKQQLGENHPNTTMIRNHYNSMLKQKQHR